MKKPNPHNRKLCYEGELEFALHGNKETLIGRLGICPNLVFSRDINMYTGKPVSRKCCCMLFKKELLRYFSKSGASVHRLNQCNIKLARQLAKEK